MKHKYRVVAFKTSKKADAYRFYWLPNAKFNKVCAKSFWFKIALDNCVPMYFFKDLREMREAMAYEGCSLRCASQRRFKISWE